MKRALLWDEGPGEVRLGLLEDAHLAELRLIRPRHPERALMAAGERYTARILSALGPGRRLATLGFGDDVILQPAPGLPEGCMIAVEMVRAPLPEPGRWKRARVKPVDDAPRAQPSWHFSAEPWQKALQHYGSYADEIVCPDANVALNVERELGKDCPAVRIDAEEIADADFDGLIAAAVSGLVPIEGGEISFEPTRAMMMVDVDGTGSPVALNRAAARAIPALLRRYDIGGPVGIDFVSMGSRAERVEIDAILAEACQPLGQHERTAINGFGFCQIIRPRLGPSVPEALCGIHPGRLSIESRAIQLLREAGRATGIGPRHLVAAPPIIDFIAERSHEVAALQFSVGAEIKLVPDANATGYGHVHVSQA